MTKMHLHIALIIVVAGLVAWRHISRAGRASGINRPRNLILMLIVVTGSVAFENRDALTAVFTAARTDVPILITPTGLVLRNHYRDQYTRVISATREAGGDPNRARAALGTVVNSIYQAHLLELDDTSATAMTRIARGLDVALLDRDPMGCITPDHSAEFRDATKLATQSTDIDQTNAGILEQIATDPALPAAPLATEAMLALSRTALQKLDAGELPIVARLLHSRRAPANSAEARALCDFRIKMMDAELSGPPGTLRRMFASLKAAHRQ